MSITNIIDTEYFSSSDLSLVSLISLSYPIEAIDKSNPQKSLFFFKRDKNLEELIQQFWRKELKVEPQQYFSQIKAVKARLYGGGL